MALSYTPDSYHQRVITLTPPSGGVRQYELAAVDVDASASSQYGGIVLPVTATIVAPSGAVERRTFRAMVPVALPFRPVESGTYRILLEEDAHSKLRGSLDLEVAPANQEL